MSSFAASAASPRPDRRRHWGRRWRRWDGHTARRDEAGEVVHVAVGVVVHQAVAEPDDPLEAEVVLQPPLDASCVAPGCGWDSAGIARS
jgi:hypothetical protein